MLHIRLRRSTGARGAPSWQDRQRQEPSGEERLGKEKAADGTRRPSCGLAGSHRPFSTGWGIVVSTTPNRASRFGNNMVGAGASVKGSAAAHAANVPAGPGVSRGVTPNTGDTMVGRETMAVCLALPAPRLARASATDPGDVHGGTADDGGPNAGVPAPCQPCPAPPSRRARPPTGVGDARRWPTDPPTSSIPHSSPTTPRPLDPRRSQGDAWLSRPGHINARGVRGANTTGLAGLEPGAGPPAAASRRHSVPARPSIGPRETGTRNAANKEVSAGVASRADEPVPPAGAPGAARALGDEPPRSRTTPRRPLARRGRRRGRSGDPAA